MNWRHYPYLLLSIIMSLTLACSSKKKTNEMDSSESGGIQLDDDDGKKEKSKAKGEELDLSDEGLKLDDDDDVKATRVSKKYTGSYKRLKSAVKGKNSDKAVAAAAKILAIEPSNLQALNGLAMHYLSKGLREMARTLLLRAFVDHPKNSRTSS